jgi:hypothetical protein
MVGTPILQAVLAPSVFRFHPPPLWYVSNGETKVGPVNTSVLIRGVERGRVPETSRVRAFDGIWRGLSSVREIAVLSGKPSTDPAPEQLAEWGGVVSRLRDDDVMCHTVARLALSLTGAESAMVHYRGRHGRTLFTRAILGSVSKARLGYPLSEFDLVLRSARSGVPVQGPPYGPVEDELSKRFATSHEGVGAVAMIPILVGSELHAMLEVSRAGYSFRCDDLKRAERIGRRAVASRLR